MKTKTFLLTSKWQDCEISEKEALQWIKDSGFYNETFILDWIILGASVMLKDGLILSLND